MLQISKILVLISLTTGSLAFAQEFPVQARLFAGGVTVDPQNINTTIEAQSLKKIDKATQYGVEITYPLFKYLDIGMRYTKHTVDNDENPSSEATDYRVKIDQDAVLLIARVPFIQTDIFRMDVFGGIGGTNTSLNIKTASQDGSLEKKASEGWFASPYSAVGASAAIGFKWIYFVVEGGMQTNKVTGLDRNGSVNAAIDTVDLTGPYVSVGLMFNGIPGSRK